MVIACLFPGQGSQSPGMGLEVRDAFPEARKAFEEADDALGESLSRIIFEGTVEALKRTEITQPAILTTSVAMWRTLTARLPDFSPDYVAGHSLGEWSALVAAGAVDFADAVRLVRHRGRAMQEAVPEGMGSMSAVMGLQADRVEEICRTTSASTGAVVAPANINSPEQIVISGAAAAVESASEALQEAGAKKVIPLPVSAPFHCALMQPAADALAEAMEQVSFHDPKFPVVGNVKAQPYHTADEAKALLVQQVTAPVLWVDSLRWLLEKGVSSAVEVGPGKVLAGLARRVDRKFPVHVTESLEALEKTIGILGPA
ncbi:MAG: ACP S-malonyltransferase [Myxococcota bacterium]